MSDPQGPSVDKLTMHSPDLTQRNIEQLAKLFPTVVTEALDPDGKPVHALDFDLLRQELSAHVVEGPRERYQLDWPGKRAALFAANAPIAKTLRPMRDESLDFDTTRNVIIEGDNLDALKLLQESYLGKVKFVYLDPPYNTGNDFVYSDTFAASRDEELRRSAQIDEDGARLVTNTDAAGRFHSNWLSMMFPRLKLARNLLAPDGVLAVSIDENEHRNLVALGTEVFGQDAYVGEIVIKNSSKNDQAFISIQHEYLVFFVRNRSHNAGDWVELKEGLDEIYAAFEGFRAEHGDDWQAIHRAALAFYRKYPPSHPVARSKHYSWMDERGIYFPDNIAGPNDGQYVYEVEHPVTGQPCKMPSTGWRYPHSTMLERIAQGRVHFGPDHTTVPNNKTYLRDTEAQNLASIRFVDGRAASKRLQKLFGEKVFTNPKDEYLLRDIYRAVGVTSDDIVLDLFSGSGSALHAVLELNADTGSNCSYIGVQIAEDLRESLKTARGAAKKVTTNAIAMLERVGVSPTVAEICKQRMRLVADSMAEHAGLDRGFRVFRVDTTNMNQVFSTPDSAAQQSLDRLSESVKSDRTAEDLLFEILLSWGLDPTLPITLENVAGRNVHIVAEGALVTCFDGRVEDDLTRELAEREPLRVVFKDSGFASDAARINAEQIFSELSPATDVKVV